MKSLKIGITGVRGVVGETFTPLLAVQFANAFATSVGGGDVYVCEDARPSGKMVKSAVISALLAAGCRPVDLGVCPVPSLQFAVAGSGASGGIAISAGHNPEDWNALKFINGSGMYFDQLEGEELLDIYHEGEFIKAPWDRIQPLESRNGAVDAHLAKISDYVDSRPIRKAGIHVALDTCNGSCSAPAARLLEQLGCKVAALNDDPGEPFPHDPEPNRNNMRQLSSLVKAAGCDAGFILDTAGERLALVDEKGAPVSEESTIALCAAFHFEKPGAAAGPVVVNVSTTRAVDDIAAAHGAGVIRTQVGQAHVAGSAVKRRAAIAGEGSGGVILPGVHYACDALAAMAFILEGLARRRQSVSEAVASLPQYVMLKEKHYFDYSIIHRIVRRARRNIVADTKKHMLDLSDGIKINRRGSWLHIRPSNTEPLIRIIAEARTLRGAQQLMERGKEYLEI